MSVRIVEWSPAAGTGRVERFLDRPAFDEQAEAVAREVLDEVRRHGDRAVSACTARFDGASLRPAAFRVSADELAAARRRVPRDLRRAVGEARRRIAVFARAGLRRDWSIATPRGGRAGQQYVPLQRVGAYVPGGAAPLASTALMTVTLGKVAGVPELVACTPCDADGAVDPVVLYALETAGATEIYRVGGIQSIAMMAYGTRTVRKVDKIVGPGGAYVTAAKRQVYGHVALDLVAGPSEIAVLADSSADARHVAADLLSQAEHGTGWEKALLVTTSRRLAAATARELDSQAAALGRRETVATVMKRGMLLVVVRTLEHGMTLCNRFAPEHLELMVREPRRWMKRVRSAGAIFLGKWTPEAAGDFVAGPSHVLPTGGAAARFSGLTVEDFRRHSSFMAFTRADLCDTLPVIEAFGRVEGLDAHARSARIRFEKQ